MTRAFTLADLTGPVAKASAQAVPRSIRLTPQVPHKHPHFRGDDDLVRLPGTADGDVVLTNAAACTALAVDVVRTLFPDDGANTLDARLAGHAQQQTMGVGVRSTPTITSSTVRCRSRFADVVIDEAELVLSLDGQGVQRVTGHAVHGVVVDGDLVDAGHADDVVARALAALSVDRSGAMFLGRQLRPKLFGRRYLPTVEVPPSSHMDMRDWRRLRFTSGPWVCGWRAVFVVDDAGELEFRCRADGVESVLFEPYG